MDEGPSPGADTDVVDAIAFAVRAHGRQLRKDQRTPYIVHPLGVLRHLTADLGVVRPVLMEAAVLHDVLEDTPTVRAALAQRFGEPVAALVEELTLPAELHGPTVADAAKTEALVASITTASWPAVLVKLCDRWDNLRDLPNAAWSEAKRASYLGQTAQILEALAQRRARSPPPAALNGPIVDAASAVRRLGTGP